MRGLSRTQSKRAKKGCHGVSATGHRGAAAAVAAATLLTAGLAIWRIGAKSIGFDEGVTAALVTADWRSFQRVVLVGGERNAALYVLLLRGWMWLGSGDAWLRLPSAFAVVMTVPLLAALGRRLFNPWTGAVAGLLLATNPFAVRHAQQARSYALVMLLVTLSALLLVGALDMRHKPSQQWLGWALVSGAAVYVHAIAVTAAVSQLAAALTAGRVRRQALRWPAVALALLATLVAPLAWRLADQGTAQIAWIPESTPADTVSAIRELSGATWTSPLIGLYALAWLAAMARPSRPIAVVALFAAGPLLSVYLVSALGQPLFVPRYLIVALPFLELLAAAGLVHLATRRATRIVAVTVMAAIAVGGLVGTARWQTAPATEQFREAAAFVRDRAQPGDGMAFFDPTSQAAFAFYGGGRMPVSVFPAVKSGGSLYDGRPSLATLEQELGSGDRAVIGRMRLWVLESHDDSSWPRALRQTFNAALARQGLQHRETFRWPGVEVTLFTR